MDGLLRIKYKEDIHNLCVICLNKKKNNSYVFSCKQCSNTFHEDCIYKLIKYKNVCPICRYEITNFIVIDPELLFFYRNFIIYQHTTLQFILFINFIKTIISIILVSISLISIYFIVL